MKFLCISLEIILLICLVLRKKHLLKDLLQNHEDQTLGFSEVKIDILHILKRTCGLPENQYAAFLDNAK